MLVPSVRGQDLTLNILSSRKKEQASLPVKKRANESGGWTNGHADTLRIYPRLKYYSLMLASLGFNC
ncbi:hypothetical protein KUL113_24380 [Tenacibaculum sp. KUL113]|nr:hypothetical protein KUL113_24380 [Tenacibaculum sp. KUL113]GFD85005.1 hypothetical protein KUL150_10640 [Alteromonas sp. KUL150]